MLELLCASSFSNTHLNRTRIYGIFVPLSLSDIWEKHFSAFVRFEQSQHRKIDLHIDVNLWQSHIHLADLFPKVLKRSHKKNFHFAISNEVFSAESTMKQNEKRQKKTSIYFMAAARELASLVLRSMAFRCECVVYVEIPKRLLLANNNNQCADKTKRIYM